MLGAGNVCEAQITLARWRPTFCPNGNLDEGDRQRGDSHGTADFQMPSAPVGLPFPGKRSILWAVPKLMLLNEVNAKYERFIQLRNNVKLVLDFLCANVSL
jgi:hypothetical protein